MNYHRSIVKTNWACFSCRQSIRHPYGPYQGPQPVCPQCRRQTVFLGDKVHIPPKHKAREWEKLFENVMAARRERLIANERWIVARRHELERHLDKLQRTRPNNPSHAQHLRHEIRLYSRYLGVAVER